MTRPETATGRNNSSNPLQVSYLNKVMKRLTIVGSVLTVFLISTSFWGFYAHKRINRLAVFILPPEMIGFYKKNISYLTERAVAPDHRRYAVVEEAPRHYIDLDHYG